MLETTDQVGYHGGVGIPDERLDACGRLGLTQAAQSLNL